MGQAKGRVRSRDEGMRRAPFTPPAPNPARAGRNRETGRKNLSPSYSSKRKCPEHTSRVRI
eukprot:5231178-Pyramimonas_sp.AAC.1